MKIHKLFENIEIKLICLLLAVVLWLYANNPIGTGVIDKVITFISRGDQGIITFRNVPVQIVGLQKKWKSNPREILLEVKCIVAEIEIDNFQAVVNLRRKDEESRQVILTSDNVALPKGLLFLKAEPEEIRIILRED